MGCSKKTHDNEGKVCKSHEKRKTLDPTPGNGLQVPYHGSYTRTTIKQLLQDDRECFSACNMPCLFISVFPVCIGRRFRSGIDFGPRGIFTPKHKVMHHFFYHFSTFCAFEHGKINRNEWEHSEDARLTTHEVIACIYAKKDREVVYAQKSVVSRLKQRVVLCYQLHSVLDSSSHAHEHLAKDLTANDVGSISAVSWNYQGEGMGGRCVMPQQRNEVIKKDFSVMKRRWRSRRE